LAAMSGIGQRGPIERDKGSPGEIVEVGVGVELDRRRVLDAIGRNQWGAILGGGRGDGEKRDQSCESDARENPRVSNLILRSEAKPRVSKEAPEGCARSARAGAPPRQAWGRPFEAPSGRLRARGEIENNKGNTGAAFPTAPHLHSGPSVYAIGLADQGARKAHT